MTRVLGIVLAFSIVAAGGCAIGGRTVTESRAVSTFVGELRSGLNGQADPVMCDWLENESGEKLLVVYPDLWDVLYAPTRVVDERGQLIATEGDLVRVTGEYGEIAEALCPGRVFRADTVEVLPQSP